jgi:hypothetical protein
MIRFEASERENGFKAVSTAEPEGGRSREKYSHFVAVFDGVIYGPEAFGWLSYVVGI